MRNVFEQALEGEQRDCIEKIKHTLLLHGAKAAAMTGSGSVVFGLFSDETSCRAACDALQSSYRACLELAADNGIESVAFCCISTGEFHFPPYEAAEIAVHTVTDFLAHSQGFLAQFACLLLYIEY